MKHKLEYLITIIGIKILKLFPESSRFKFAENLATLGYKLIKKRRLTALANLKLAFPEKTDIQREKIAINSYKIMAKAFLSSLWFDEYLAKDENIKFIGMEKVEELYAKGRGVMLATMHMGNMEASMKAAEKYPVISVAKEQRNPYIDRLITKNRKNLNVTILKKSKTTSRELIEHIEKKEIIALFSDHRDSGAKVEFFGEETIAPTGAISLALKYDLPFAWCYNVFNKDNTCTTRFLVMDLDRTDNFKEDVKTNTQKLISNMEKAIIENPSQWMWFHDRWKLHKKLYRRDESNKPK